MKKVVLSQFEHTDWTSFGMIIFLALFVGVLFWTGRKQSKALYKELSKLPLEGDQ